MKSSLVVRGLLAALAALAFTCGNAATTSTGTRADKLASASSPDRIKTLEIAVEALRYAMVAGDEKLLRDLTDPGLSYGHSKGLIQNQDEFIKPLVGPTAPGKFLSIALSRQTVGISGDVAVVRHVFDGVNESPTGQVSNSHISVLQVWRLDNSKWKLLARQAVALPPTNFPPPALPAAQSEPAPK